MTTRVPNLLQLVISLPLLALSACGSASPPSSCTPTVIGPVTASATWDELPKVVQLDANTCRYFAATRGTCGSYVWIAYATGGAGDSTTQYFDASGNLVYTQFTFDIVRQCADGTSDTVCRTGCRPTDCQTVTTEVVSPGSAKAPASCEYSNPGLS